MKHARALMLTSVSSLVLGLAATAFAPAAFAADALLSGTITSSSGEKLGGVTVSAKQEGSTITTSVYTDESWQLLLPALPDGKYRVWAQALGFETSKGEVDLGAAKHEDLKLAAITDREQMIRQLPSELLVAALPDETRRGRAHQEGVHQPVHRLPFAGLSAPVQVRRGGLEQDHQPDEDGGEHRRHAAQSEGQRHHRIQPEGARRLSRARPRTGRDLDEVQAATAADRRSRPRDLDAL